jgi:hypothetical protein
MERKTKELHYKRAVLQGVNTTLQLALEDIFNAVPLPEGRLEYLGLNNDEGRVMLDERHHQALLCTTMTTYTKGALQAIMGRKAQSRNWPIRQTLPPSLPGADETEFLDGILFFGVSNNHVVFLPSRSCTSENLEDYLNYLLSMEPNGPGGPVVSLNDRSPREYRRKRFKHVRGFTINTELDAKSRAHREKTKKTSTLTFTPVGHAWEAVKSLIAQIGGQLPEDEILLEEDFDPEDVHVKIEISSHKKDLETSGPFLDVLANSLRHVESDVVRVEFDDGTILRGDQLKTKKAIRLDCSNNMPVANQVDTAIHGYLQELLKSGMVTEEK